MPNKKNKSKNNNSNNSAAPSAAASTSASSTTQSDTSHIRQAALDAAADKTQTHASTLTQEVVDAAINLPYHLNPTLTDAEKEEERVKQEKRQKKAEIAAEGRQQWNKEKKRRDVERNARQKARRMEKLVNGVGGDSDDEEGAGQNGNGNKKSKTSSDSNTDSWDNYQGEWDHLIDWDSPQTNYIRKEMYQYVEVEGADSYDTWQAKCKLCKNSKKKPTYFDYDHFASDSHQQKVKDREHATNILKTLIESDYDTSRPLQHPIMVPLPKIPKSDSECVMLVNKFDSYYKHVNIPYLRCLMCGETHDEELTEEMLKATQESFDTNDGGESAIKDGIASWSHLRTKAHLKHAWAYTDEAVGDTYYKQIVQKVEKNRKDLEDNDREGFYQCNSYGNRRDSEEEYGSETEEP